ncbi:MAG: ferrochelatase [Nitrospiraceae bacterium]|nr:ferrochelatase [Nitrospiraceae bacterium]
MSVDAVILVSFGGPEGMDDVMPFLENVLRGKNVPEDRKLQVAEHYKQFGGVSPINSQNRALIDAIKDELEMCDIRLPIYFGNRNWHPLLSDVLKQMRDDGIKHALAIVTSAYSSYSGCKQYLDNIQRAVDMVDGTVIIQKLRQYYNHPGFVEANIDRVRDAIETLPNPTDSFAVAFTAHSIPIAMAKTCPYDEQLREVAGVIACQLKIADWKLVFQSRSGPPDQPWLDPDILDHIRTLKAKGCGQLVVAPIGFISDHLEVVYDLDQQAKKLCSELGIAMIRAGTVGLHPAVVSMFRELIEEQIRPGMERRVYGSGTAWPDVCPPDCCSYTFGRSSD